MALMEDAVAVRLGEAEHVIELRREETAPGHT